MTNGWSPWRATWADPASVIRSVDFIDGQVDDWALGNNAGTTISPHTEDELREDCEKAAPLSGKEL